MKKVYEAGSLSEAHFLVGFLDERGIVALIQGERLVALRGELPGNTYPEIWVQDDEKYAEARHYILDEYEKRKSTDALDTSWKCVGCGEMVGDQFTDCWSCGNAKSSA